MRIRLRSIIRIKHPTVPRIEAVEIPFFISYSLCLVYMILSTSFYYQYISSLWKPIFVFCIGLLVVYEIIRNGLNWKNLVTIGVVLLLFINIVRVGQGMAQNGIAAIMFYMFCARAVSFRKISWYTILISGVMLALIVISSLIGIVPNYVEQITRHREYLGFLYALYGPTIMSNISMLWIYLKKNDMTIKGTVFHILLNLFFYMRTHSRLCFFLTVLMLLFGLYLRNHSKFILQRKALCYGMICSFPMAAMFSYILTTRFNNALPWMAALNRLIEGRLALGQQSIKQIGVKPFGIAGINWIGNALDMYGNKSNEPYLVVDNYYIQVMQRFGFVFLIVTLLFMAYACYRAYRNQDIYLLSIFTVLAVHFMMDNLHMYLQYNTFWLATGCVVFARWEKGSQTVLPTEKTEIP